MSDQVTAPAEPKLDAKGRLETLTRHMSGRQAAPAVSSMGHDDWDCASAEALMQVYEGQTPTVYYADPPPAPRRAAPTAAFAASTAAPGYVDPVMPSAASFAATAMGNQALGAQSVAGQSLASVSLEDLAQDRAWLDGRFSELSDRLEATMKRLDPAEQIAPLTRRLDGIEQTLRVELADLVRRDALTGLEHQVGDLGRQLATARAKLDRLDGIEAQLSALTQLAETASDVPAHTTGFTPDLDIDKLVHHAVDQTVQRMARDHVPTAGPAFDVDALADRTALRTAERMAAAPSRGAPVEGVSELRTLVSGYVDEYRREQSQTAAALATMQEALVRLIDRIDQYDEEVAGEVPGLAGHALPHQLEPGKAGVAFYAPPETAPPKAVDGERFVEVTDERGMRPGRRATDAVPPHTEPQSTTGQADGSSMAPRQPAPRAAHTKLPDETSRVPRRPATPTVEPELDPAAQAQAMAAERARLAAERAAQAAQAQVAQAQSSSPGRRPSVRGPDAPQPRVEATAADAETPAAAGAKPRTMRKKAAGGSTTASRGLKIASLAVGAMTLSYLAHMFVSGRFPVAKLEDRVPAIEAAPARPTPPRVAPSQFTDAPGTDGTKRIIPIIPGAPATAPGVALGTPAAATPSARPQQEPAPSSPNTMPDSFRPKSVPETIDSDIQSNNMRPAQPTTPQGPVAAGVRTSQATISGIALDNGSMPNPTELARRMATPIGQPQQQPSQQPPTAGLQPISAPAQGEPLPAADPISRGPVEMPPALIGPNSLRIAAQQGEPGAQFEVAARFAEGKGVKQDFPQAIAWYTRASQKGFVPAQYRLATLYERGLGTSVDLTRAKVWYRRAADQGHVKSMHNLAVLAAGPQQAEPDYPTAVRWFTEAAERGLADSQFNLGVLAENGLGMQKDTLHAYKWFALAARSGDQGATRRRDQLAASFSPDQARQAEQLVAGWRAKPTEVKANDPRAATHAYAAEKEAAFLAAQRQMEQRQSQDQQKRDVAPMPPPPAAGNAPKAKQARTTRG